MGTIAAHLEERLKTVDTPLPVSIQGQYTEEQQQLLAATRLGMRPALQQDFKREVFSLLEEHIPQSAPVLRYTMSFAIGTHLTYEQVKRIAALPYVKHVC